MLLFHLGFSSADSLDERNHLVLRRNHSNDVLVVRELQLRDALKTLLEMRLNAHRVLRLGQDLQQFIVGQEEKPATSHHSQVTRKNLSSPIDVHTHAGSAFDNHVTLIFDLDDLKVNV